MKTISGMTASMQAIYNLSQLQGAGAGDTQLLDRPLRILMAMCFVLLLLVCANVANLQLARSATRLKELNVRLALGARRMRLIRQQLTESVLLATFGGLVSIPMAMWLSPALTYLIPPANVPIRFGDLRITPLILAFVIAVCALSALISGIVPAVASTRLNVNEYLKEGGRSGSAGARSRRLQALLVIVEVTLAVVALAGAGIFVKSYSKAMAINPGFDARGVLVGHLYLRTGGFNGEQGSQISSRLRLQFQQTGGVRAAAHADQIPLGFSNAGPWNVLEIDGYQPPAGQQITCDRAAVSPGYFSLLRIPLIEGRDFNGDDKRKAPQVIIVNQTFAKRYLAGSSAVGRQVKVSGKPSTVVGVAGDSKIFSLGENAKPYFYRPYDQGYNSGSNLAFFVRTNGDPLNMVARVRRVPTSMDGRLAAFEAIPMTEYNGAAVLPQRLAASILTFLGVLCLLLSGVGLYGVLTCAVSERVRETGIRMALGAEPLNVVKTVLRRALILTGTGVAAGAAIALTAGRLASGFLYGVSPADPMVYFTAAVFLALVAAPASYLPARRALRADPMGSLRSQ
jgi:predicted permease